MTSLSNLRMPGLLDQLDNWPFDHVKVASATNPNAHYPNLAAALPVLAPGGVIIPDIATHTGPFTLDDNTILGFDNFTTVLQSSTNDSTVLTVNDSGAAVERVLIFNTGGGTTTKLVANSQNQFRMYRPYLLGSGSPTSCYGLHSTGGDTYMIQPYISVAGGSTNNSLRLDTAASTVIVEGGIIDAGDIVLNHSGAILELRGPQIRSAVSITVTAGTIRGWYIDSNGVVRLVGDYELFKLGYPANDVWSSGASASNSDFVSTIATLPGGAVLTYGAVSSGAAANLVPSATTQAAKMVLHNTTRGTSALISNVVTGTSTITLTAAVPAGWATTDAITIRSQTNTSNIGSSRFIDFEIVSDIDALCKSVEFSVLFNDTGGGGNRIVFHPYETNNNSKRVGLRNPAANIAAEGATAPIPLTSSRFCALWSASGAGTINQNIWRLVREGAAFR